MVLGVRGQHRCPVKWVSHPSWDTSPRATSWVRRGVEGPESVEQTHSRIHSQCTQSPALCVHALDTSRSFSPNSHPEDPSCPHGKPTESWAWPPHSQGDEGDLVPRQKHSRSLEPAPGGGKQGVQTVWGAGLGTQVHTAPPTSPQYQMITATAKPPVEGVGGVHPQAGASRLY